jgi:hypothetical protein
MDFDKLIRHKKYSVAISSIVVSELTSHGEKYDDIPFLHTLIIVDFSAYHAYQCGTRISTINKSNMTRSIPNAQHCVKDDYKIISQALDEGGEFIFTFDRKFMNMKKNMQIDISDSRLKVVDCNEGVAHFENTLFPPVVD